MCLGVPGLVVEVDELTALVDFWGVRRRVRLDLADEPVVVGDYVLNHVGFVIRRIPSEDVQTTLSMYEELVRANTGRGPTDRRWSSSSPTTASSTSRGCARRAAPSRS